MNKLKIIVGLMVAFVGSGSYLSAQICPVVAGSEKVTNGDFESGYTGFTNTGLTLCPGACSSPMNGDNYFITSNPNNQNTSYFKSMTDHSPVGTNMLIFDFNTSSVNDPIYSTTVSVVAGQVYFFSAWFANIAQGNVTACGTCPGGQYISASPILKFKINGVDQGIVKVDSITNNWNQYFTNWTATSTGTVTIEIVNLRGGNISNDLAIDDISFSSGCEKIPNLNSLGQSSVLIDTVNMCAFNFPYVLDPSLPGTYGYGWRNSAGALLGGTNNGTTYSVASAPVDGTKYFLCYEYIAGCPRTDSVIFKSTPLAVNLGSDKVMCAPVNIVLYSGVTNPPVTVQWKKNTVNVATTATYTATDIGTYQVDISRAGCGSASDIVNITNPVSTISGSGTYCSGSNTSSFTVTGSTSVKWYIDNVSTTVLSTATTYTPAHTATNVSVPGCASGLYVEDASSFPGTIIPVSAVPSFVANAPCGSNSNYSGNADIQIEINQSLTLSSVDYFQNSGWGNGTFTFSLFNNMNSGSSSYCNNCSPAGAYEGPTGAALYTVTTATLTAPASGSLQRTLPVTYTFAPGKYWIRLSATSTAMGAFTCNPALVAGSSNWVTPFVDNTGNNVARIISGNYNNGGGAGMGALFNIKFQVGSSNACSRLFICATANCVAPVELLTFDVKKQANTTVVLWETASEQNSAYYNVQRSTDGIHFETVGQLAAAGNSSVIHSYTYIDKDAASLAETVYYRLEQVDVDGAKQYSEIKSIRNEALFPSVVLYPTPVKRGQNVFLNIESTSTEALFVEIYDNPGKVVSAGQYALTQGVNTVELNTSTLSSGLYHLRVLGSTNKTVKFIVE